MASLSSWLWGTSQLDEAVDKATSELIPSGSEDVALNLEICDQVRSKSAPAKDAMRALKRRLNHKNPNVQLLALGLTDVCVKNGGDHFLTEIASREFIDNLVSILKVPGLNHAVKSDILKYIQNWSLAFEGKPSLSYVGQVYKTLKDEGYSFPPKDLALANTAMVDTSTAPEWIDSDVCLRCRTPFTFTNRKHHCRNCGQVFDQQCSSKTMPLPHFGITQAVRVCDGCYSKLSRKAERSDKGHRHSASMYSPRHNSARDLADAELQRAIQLSLEEVGAHGHKRPGYVPYYPSSWQPSEPPLVDRTTHPNGSKPVPGPAEEEDDPDLRAAIEASLREVNMPKPSAPLGLPSTEETPSYSNVGRPQSYPPTVTPTPVAPFKLPDYDLEPLESDAILTFSQTVEQVQAQGGGDLSRYPAVSELFDKANGLRPKLAISLDDTGKKEQILSEMHDKLSQAVKLYDKLLTNQLSNPTWRRSTTQQRSATQSNPIANGYAQWTPSAPVEQFAPLQSQVPQVSQAPQVPHSPVTQAAYQSQYMSYSQMPHNYTPLPSSQPPYSYTDPEPQHQPTSLPVLQPIQPPPLASIPQTATTTTQLSSSTLSPQPPSQLQTQSQPQPQAATPQPQPPPPPMPSTILSRSHTVSSRTVTSPPPPSTLARSSTLSHSPTATRYQASQPLHAARYHPVPEAQRPAPLPQFPTAPTSNPQSFDLHAPSVPIGLPVSQERREELLIDL